MNASLESEMCTCTHTHMHTDTRAHRYTCTHTHRCITDAHTCANTISMGTFVHRDASYSHTQKRTHSHMCRHAHMHVQMHYTFTHTHMCRAAHIHMHEPACACTQCAPYVHAHVHMCMHAHTHAHALHWETRISCLGAQLQPQRCMFSDAALPSMSRHPRTVRRVHRGHSASGVHRTEGEGIRLRRSPSSTDFRPLVGPERPGCEEARGPIRGVEPLARPPANTGKCAVFLHGIRRERPASARHCRRSAWLKKGVWVAPRAHGWGRAGDWENAGVWVRLARSRRAWSPLCPRASSSDPCG